MPFATQPPTINITKIISKYAPPKSPILYYYCRYQFTNVFIKSIFNSTIYNRQNINQNSNILSVVSVPVFWIVVINPSTQSPKFSQITPINVSKNKPIDTILTISNTIHIPQNKQQNKNKQVTKKRNTKNLTILAQ